MGVRAFKSVPLFFFSLPLSGRSPDRTEILLSGTLSLNSTNQIMNTNLQDGWLKSAKLERGQVLQEGFLFTTSYKASLLLWKEICREKWRNDSIRHFHI